ncbi:hypothetical protein BDQ17DRAFT_1538217 [Cyathus striatus]|nr:hypothetical protein BDQ17DRAFT_1538217 [Cyathus striatus]
MKRGAEKQITKEQGSDDEEVQEIPGGGFKKADDAILSSRPMRGLPKRAMGSAPLPAASANGSFTSVSNASSAPKPSGFTGFGVPSSSEFSFKPQNATGLGATPAQPLDPSDKRFSTYHVFGAATSINPFGKPSGAPVSFFGGESKQSQKPHPPEPPYLEPLLEQSVWKSGCTCFCFDKPVPSTTCSEAPRRLKQLLSLGSVLENFSGSIGNPVGFGFGTKTESEKPESEAEGSGENTAENKPENAGGLSIRNPHDEEGEGEEEEETVHVIRVKAHRMKKEGEKGDAGWAELGVGMLRLKKHKETGSRRVLMRNSSNGKININFKIYSGLKPLQNKKALTNENQVTELKEALERETAFVKAKGETDA